LNNLEFHALDLIAIVVVQSHDGERGDDAMETQGLARFPRSECSKRKDLSLSAQKRIYRGSVWGIWFGSETKKLKLGFGELSSPAVCEAAPVRRG
jgi:hypothetical protein